MPISIFGFLRIILLALLWTAANSRISKQKQSLPSASSLNHDKREDGISIPPSDLSKINSIRQEIGTATKNRNRDSNRKKLSLKKQSVSIKKAPGFRGGSQLGRVSYISSCTKI